MDDVRIFLPFPPSVNTYWRHVVLGKHPRQRVATILSEKGRRYKVAVRDAVTSQRVATGFCANVQVFVRLFAPDNRCRDVDNYAKALLDGLVEAGVLKDDSLVRDLRLVWGGVKAGGEAEVVIRRVQQNG